MSATREHRNATKIEEAAEGIGSAIEQVSRLELDLGALLPDDWKPLDKELRDLEQAHLRLMERIGG